MPNRFKYHAQDPISSYTHYIGAVFSIIMCAIWFCYGVFARLDLQVIISMLVFGGSLVALYSASCTYHYVAEKKSYKVRLRKLDHSMIYILIVGSYTPLVLKFYENGIRTVLILWGIALAGIIMKVCWLNAPRWLYTCLYLALGWAVIFMRSMFTNMPIGCTILIALGGVAYSIGAIFYIIKKPNISATWGFHEIFHLCILLGSLFHIIAMTLYVL